MKAHPLWATANVWTKRMLTTLMNGVERSKWFRQYDKVFAERNLFTAFQQVAKNDGASSVDYVSVHEFAQQIPENLWRLSDALKKGLVHVLNADLKACWLSCRRRSPMAKCCL